MTIAEELKQIIDEHCVRKSVNDAQPFVESFIARLVAYIHDDYQNSLAIMQNAISQLERVNDLAETVMLSMAGNDINSLSSRFSTEPSSSMKIALLPWDETVIRRVMEKFMVSTSQPMPLDVPDLKTASLFTPDECRQYISYGLDSISRYGLHTSWDKNTIGFVTILMFMMYAFCKQEHTLDLLFNGYYNIIDRFNTTGKHQLARDLAENIIKIGYREDMRAEGYYAASRAYTGCHHSVAGLLYFNIALSYLKENTALIPKGSPLKWYGRW